MHQRNLDYGIIGNCQILAMISRDASIDWACFPRFDSPSVFAKLLDDDIGGSFSIQPEDKEFSSEQFYQRNTNILVTRFQTRDGIFEVHDFAPRFTLHERYFRPSAIYRIVRLISGNPRIVVKCDPRLDYARKAPEIKVGSNHIDYGADLRLTTDTPLSYILEQRAFKLNSDQYFVMTYGAPLESGLKFTAEEFYERTKSYWETWVKSSNIGELYQDEVIRAALALKLHYFHDTGAFIAATTTSLPESDQSTRNWDYRYCWLRDAYFTIRALDMLGKFTEKEKFHSYLSNIIHSDLYLRENGHLQPVYSVSGERALIESELDHLAGFKNNKPVRIGNDAYTHKQFDVYGEMVYCLAPIFFDRRLISYDHNRLFIDFQVLVQKSIELFNKPDAGIWEFRSDEGVHTFSQIFCWGAADQGAKVAAHLGRVDLASKWAHKAAEMKEIILREAWNEELGMFTQRFNGNNADASNLLMHEIGIIDAKDPRYVSTIKKYGELLRKGDYVYRYVTEDDFGLPKTSFTICTFWYISALNAIGEHAEAKRLYENLLRKSNHLGLLSEDIDAETGELWGNFPQTYSLVGIITVAKQLAECGVDTNSPICHLSQISE